jgi:hypothetical protein
VFVSTVDDIIAGSSAVRQSNTILARSWARGGRFHNHFVIAVWRANQAESRHVKYWITALVILMSLSASLALADDFKTTNGKEYKDATVTRVEPDGIVLRTKSGISKIYFVELPKEVQERFHYDPQKTLPYRAAEAEAAKQRVQQQQTASPAATGTPSNIFTAKVAGIRAEHERQIKTAIAAGEPEQLHRVGAICNDGSESSAIGRDACSRHGGVRCWKFSDGTCQ